MNVPNWSLGLGLAVALSATAVSAQPAAAPQTRTSATAADITALVAKARADRKPDQALLIQRVLQLAPYSLNLEYRTAAAPAAVHEKDAEMFFVVDGSGTLVTGGKLTKETRTNADNLSGTGIEGGTSQAVDKGDVLVVPENTPHWFNSVGGSLVLLSIHLPRPAAPPAR